jgi:hypothetical protein
LLPFSSSSIDAVNVQDFAEGAGFAGGADLGGQLTLALMTDSG